MLDDLETIRQPAGSQRTPNGEDAFAFTQNVIGDMRMRDFRVIAGGDGIGGRNGIAQLAPVLAKHEFNRKRTEIKILQGDGIRTHRDRVLSEIVIGTPRTGPPVHRINLGAWALGLLVVDVRPVVVPGSIETFGWLASTGDAIALQWRTSRAEWLFVATVPTVGIPATGFGGA